MKEIYEYKIIARFLFSDGWTERQTDWHSVQADAVSKARRFLDEEMLIRNQEEAIDMQIEGRRQILGMRDYVQ